MPNGLDTLAIALSARIASETPPSPQSISQADDLYNLALNPSTAASGETLERIARIFHSVLPPTSTSGYKATQLLQLAVVRDGTDSAYVLLGELLENGENGAPHDTRRAAWLYERAITQFNSTAAMNRLGCLYNWGAYGIHEDREKAVKLWEDAVRGGDLQAMRNLALALEGGDGVEMDRKRAVELYNQVVDVEGFGDCRFNLAWLLSGYVDEVDEDIERAVELYEKVVEDESDANAMFNLACLLTEGRGVEKSFSRAAELYRRAVEEAGHVSAMHNLGIMLSFGRDGVKKDVDMAKMLLEKAVETGRKEATFDLALLFAHDEGDGAADMDKAIEMYERAVDLVEHMGALINLAEVLSSGKNGVKMDVKRAKALSERAIAQGLLGQFDQLKWLGIEPQEVSDEPEAVVMRDHATGQGWYLVAMCNLAEMVLSGTDGERDVERGVRLIERAIGDEKFEGVYETQDLEFGELFAVLRKVGREEGWECVVRICELLVERVGHAGGFALLGQCYEEGSGVQKDLEKALSLYWKGVKAGGQECMLRLAELYLQGVNGERKVGNAVCMLCQALEGSSGRAWREAGVALAQIMERRLLG